MWLSSSGKGLDERPCVGSEGARGMLKVGSPQIGTCHRLWRSRLASTQAYFTLLFAVLSSSV